MQGKRIYQKQQQKPSFKEKEQHEDDALCLRRAD